MSPLYYLRDNSFRTLKVFSHCSCSFAEQVYGCVQRMWLIRLFSFKYSRKKNLPTQHFLDKDEYPFSTDKIYLNLFIIVCSDYL